MVAYFAAIFSLLYPHGGEDLENKMDPAVKQWDVKTGLEAILYTEAPRIYCWVLHNSVNAPPNLDKIPH